ncbi:TetR/AcrR family transcriptional regulator [Deinococcus radiophilus]|uniref:TetR/AcrR family transcriptional regulator n=1 Tax=Deinococcus radiophilus TaxID=32062 RepID=A0A3S0KDX6_9DEIO|nr:TetR/AcrR family transcriptional regulator [Deinococcus radiophilus]
MTDTRQRILHEAGALFVAHGYHGVSMREVAQAVGVTKPALYHHYADKETLFVAILEYSLGDLREIIQAMQTEGDLRGQLGVLVGRLLAQRPDHWVGLQLAAELKHIAPERRADFEGNYRRVWLGGLGQMIAQAVERGELRTDLSPADLTRGLMGILYPLVSGPAHPGREAVGSALLSIFLEGAAPR